MRKQYPGLCPFVRGDEESITESNYEEFIQEGGLALHSEWVELGGGELAPHELASLRAYIGNFFHPLKTRPQALLLSTDTRGASNAQKDDDAAVLQQIGQVVEDGSLSLA